MPIIKFSGTTQKQIEEYSKKVDEICELIVAKKENIFFINQDVDVVRGNGEYSIIVNVEWMSRLDKQQIFADHLKSFFGKEGTTVGVIFYDINEKFYLNGKKVG
ncbi:hypothetical protein STIUS_v1c00160 [Spiroplasma sp. TIUS-1]|uniref:DUF1904 family protein n=1 Tax=Spiroplasma sp. TIUS-1 TaxID=216963 RepID=UPI001396D774|nr:DUF1904 family protein [Spiroplasma sp. TIUS-1]QHX35571.1 hypothetical protein STIUS_v1c00160 [Spiroplasma sp. TIUS-1]